jgi:hypothetical protein
MDSEYKYIQSPEGMATKALIIALKQLVTINDLDGLKAEYEALQENESQQPWDVIFKDVYLHACLKKRQAIVDWLLTVYESMDDISKIALRQVFPYGRILLKK